MGGKDKSHLFIELNSVSWKVFFRQNHILIIQGISFWWSLMVK